MTKEKILVVEDSDIDRKVLTRIVESLGYSPVTAKDGVEALMFLNQYDVFKAIVTDYMMPNMDGRTLIGHLKENDKLKDVPVIIVSGIITIREIQDLLEDGASFFLPKPVNKEHLKGYLDKLTQAV